MEVDIPAVTGGWVVALVDVQLFKLNLEVIRCHLLDRLIDVAAFISGW